jgi:hypothetical protein
VGPQARVIEVGRNWATDLPQDFQLGSFLCDLIEERRVLRLGFGDPHFQARRSVRSAIAILFSVDACATVRPGRRRSRR